MVKNARQSFKERRGVPNRGFKLSRKRRTVNKPFNRRGPGGVQLLGSLGKNRPQEAGQ